MRPRRRRHTVTRCSISLAPPRPAVDDRVDFHPLVASECWRCPRPIVGHPGYLHVSRARPRRRVRPNRWPAIPRSALTGEHTLDDLGEAIPLAFGFDDPHLWSFFLSGKPWDDATEYARSPSPDDSRPARAADRLRIRDAPAGKEFLFLFDYGDEWHFGVRLVHTATAPEPDAQYPQVVASHGQAPPSTRRSRRTGTSRPRTRSSWPNGSRLKPRRSRSCGRRCRPRRWSGCRLGSWQRPAGACGPASAGTTRPSRRSGGPRAGPPAAGR